jgi:hypothetical protein
MPEDKKHPFKIDLGSIYFSPADSDADQRIVDLFDAFGYDISNSQHWRWLLNLFSQAHFERRRGRPSKWSKSSRLKLFVDLLSLRQRGKFSDHKPEQARLLKENFKLDPLYKDSSEQEIYKNLLEFFREMERATRP